MTGWQGLRGVIWIEQMGSVPEKIELCSHAGVFRCPSIYEPFGVILNPGIEMTADFAD